MLWNRFEKHADLGLLIFRLGVGAMFMFVHGGPKLLGGPERWAAVGGAMKWLGVGFAPEFWGFMAALSEFLGGLLLALGLFYRAASLFLLLTMIVAANMHLGRGDNLTRASHAIENSFIFLAMIFIGPGKYSLDALFHQRRNQKGSHE